VHREWRGVACLGLTDVLEQGCAQPLHELGGDDVGVFRRAADPLPEMIEIELFHHEDFRNPALGLSACSPIAGTGP